VKSGQAGATVGTSDPTDIGDGDRARSTDVGAQCRGPPHEHLADSRMEHIDSSRLTW
jgi:hypothetical protein